MTTLSKSGVSTERALRWCGLLTLLYILLVFVLPGNRSTIEAYNLTPFEYKIAIIIITLPLIIVWFFAFWGYAKLHEYAKAIKDTPESPAFDKLATGVSWLAWSLPLTVIVERILGGISNSQASWHSTATIISNYINLVFPVVAFIIIGAAARDMIGSSRLNLKPLSIKLTMVIFVIAGIVYCYLTLKAFDLNSLSSSHNPYFLPAWLMILTIIVPYLYGWFIGLLAAYEISFFASKVRGILYKRALMMVVGGLVAIIFSFIASQYLNSVWVLPAHLVFSYHLVLNIVFRVIGGIGFIIMAIGARRLKLIEEV